MDSIKVKIENDQLIITVDNYKKLSKELEKGINLTIATPKEKTQIKQRYAENVRMTDKEYNKLCTRYGEEKARLMIEVLDNYKGAHGKKYKSDYRAILTWVADKVLNEMPKSPIVQNNVNETYDYLEKISKDIANAQKRKSEANDRYKQIQQL
jgi:hypothetical protein